MMKETENKTAEEDVGESWPSYIASESIKGAYTLENRLLSLTTVWSSLL